MVLTPTTLCILNTKTKTKNKFKTLPLSCSVSQKEGQKQNKTAVVTNRFLFWGGGDHLDFLNLVIVLTSKVGFWMCANSLSDIV